MGVLVCGFLLYLFRCFLVPGNFPIERPKKSYSIYFPTGFSGKFWRMVNNRSYRRSLLSPFPPSFARTLTYEEFDSVTFAYNALHPVIMSPIPVIDISPLWTLCDTGKLFIFLITHPSLHFQSRIDGEMVPCHWLRDSQRFKILKTQNLAAFLLEHKNKLCPKWRNKMVFW